MLIFRLQSSFLAVGDLNVKSRRRTEWTRTQLSLKCFENQASADRVRLIYPRWHGRKTSGKDS